MEKYIPSKFVSFHELRESIKRSPTSRITLEIPGQKVLRYFNDNLNYFNTAFNIEIASDYDYTMFYTEVKRENSHIHPIYITKNIKAINVSFWKCKWKDVT